MARSALLGIFLAACAAPVALTESEPAADEPGSVDASPFQPIVAPIGLDPRLVALGARLFEDRRLSKDGSLACAGCHSLTTGGVDRLPTSTGMGGAVGAINAPTVFNSGLNFVQFWNGRAATLEEQAGGPLTEAGEMANTWPVILATIQADPGYAADFLAVSVDGVTEANVRTAIATFERSLSTPDSPFDRYLRGEEGALGPEAVAGYTNFIAYGCSSCHQGQGVGGNMYQKFGVMGDYFADRGEPTDADLGRYAVTGLEADRYVFKVPMLRNVALTAPYFHDASAATLPDAVRTMARIQLGRVLSDQEVDELVAFLVSLTGSYNGKPL